MKARPCGGGEIRDRKACYDEGKTVSAIQGKKSFALSPFEVAQYNRASLEHRGGDRCGECQ